VRSGTACEAASLLTRAAPRHGAVLPVRGLARWWARGVVDPVAVMRALPGAGWPRLGLVAVVTRFTVQDLVQTLPLALLGRRPFIPAKLPVRPEHHYRAQLVFLPVAGMGLWLLMGGTAHGLLRLTGERSDLGRVLDVVGVAMVIPMPPLWVCDMALIAANRFRLPELAFVNPAVQAWETALFGIGLHTALGVPWRHAMPAGLAASVVYVLGASRFLR
jgi:Yip1 domain